MKNINYKSDWKSVVPLLSPKLIGVPFKFDYTSGRMGAKHAIAKGDGSADDSAWENARWANTEHTAILVMHNAGELNPGVVRVTRYFDIPDVDFGDDEFNAVCDVEVEVELTSNGCTDADVVSESGAVLVFVQGAQGNPGYTPQKSVDYFDGEDGKDAIIISERIDSEGNTIVTWNNGHTTTIKRGKQGDPGYTPRKGVDYFDGNDGEDATVSSETLDDNGNTIVTWNNGHTTTILRGLRGLQGFTPYVGDNMHWWINGQDTGVLAEAKVRFDELTSEQVVHLERTLAAAWDDLDNRIHQLETR